MQEAPDSTAIRERKAGRKRMPAHLRRVQISTMIAPSTLHELEARLEHEADTIGHVIDRLLAELRRMEREAS